MREQALKHKIILFYVLTFVISWAFWLAMWRVQDGGEPSVIVFALSTLGTLGPLLSLLIIESLTLKQVSVERIYGQIRFRGTDRRWPILAGLSMLVITTLGNLSYAALGRLPGLQLIRTGPDSMGAFVLPIMVVQFAAGLLTSPLLEEPGWRGFALPHLQTRLGRTLGSLVVGVLWWLWHQGMNIAFGEMPSVYQALSMVALSFMIDSLFNLSGRNLLTAMLAHQSAGTALNFLDLGEQNWIQVGLLVAFVVWLRWQEARTVSTTQSMSTSA